MNIQYDMKAFLGQLEILYPGQYKTCVYVLPDIKEY